MDSFLHDHPIDLIEPVMRGDTLVFLVDSHFRSIHQVDSDPFEEHDLLWPPVNGDPYPFRIRISDPLFRGNARGSEFTQSIGIFQKFGGRHWGLAVQGPKGIFNRGLSDADLGLIKARMSAVSPGSLPPAPDLGLVQQAAVRQQTFFQLYERDVENHLDPILRGLGLTLYVGPDGRSGRQFQVDGGRIDLLCRDQKDGALVVLELKKGEAPQEALLQTLRYMAYVRTHLAEGKDVRGVILTEAADRTLVNVVGEVPNIQIRYYRVAIELV